MESITPSSPLFSLTIDPLTKQHLSESAKWAKILAIVGLTFVVMLLLFGVVASVFLSTAFESAQSEMEGPSSAFSGIGASAAALYFILISVLWFFPFLYLLRFANAMKIALANNDQQALNSSVHNLKRCLKFLGIVTIIVLAFYIVVLVFGIFFAGFLQNRGL